MNLLEMNLDFPFNPELPLPETGELKAVGEAIVAFCLEYLL